MTTSPGTPAVAAIAERLHRRNQFDDWAENHAVEDMIDLLAHVAALQTENERLRAALAFYADPLVYTQYCFPEQADRLGIRASIVGVDAGEKARKALPPAVPAAGEGAE